jgi:WD40 repeat protein
VLVVAAALALAVGLPPQRASGQASQRKLDQVGLGRDADGEPLPAGALRRLGTTRFRRGLGNNSMAFVDRGKKLLSVGGGEVCLWDVKTGKAIPAPAGLPGSVGSAALSPDGATLALGGADGQVRLCDRATGREIRRLNGPGGFVMAIAFSPDGKRLVAGGRFGADLYLWDATTGALIRCVPTSDAELLVFSPDSKLLVTRADRTRLRLHDLASGKVVREIHEGQDLLCWDFSPDGKTLAAGTERGQVVLWDTASGREKARLAQPVLKMKVAKNPFSPRTTGDLTGYLPAVRAIAYCPDGNCVAAVSDRVRMWDLITRRERLPLEDPFWGLSRPVFSPDGKTLAAADAGAIRLWDVGSGRRYLQAPGHESQVFHVSFSPDGKIVATESSGVDHSLRLWEAATGRELVNRRLPPYNAGFLSPDGILILGDSGAGAMRLVDVVTGHELRRFPGSLHAGFAQAFSPDGKILAVGYLQGPIDLWDWRSDTLLHRLKGHHGHTYALAFSGDGKLLASAGQDKSVRLWDLRDHRELRRGDFDFLPWAMAFSTDGKKLVTGGNDNTLRLWDTNTVREIGRIGNARHASLAVALSPDGKLLAGAGHQGIVYVWDAATGRELREFKGHRGSVRCLAFSPDGTTVASAGDDTTGILWTVNQDAGKNPRPPGKGESVDTWWDELASPNGFRALLATRRLADAPQQAVPLLMARLRPLSAADPVVVGLVRDLDSSKFAVRDRADRELQRLGDRAQPALRQALAGKPSLEARRRLEKLLGRLEEGAFPPDRLQAVRGVAALERIGTPAALAALKELAGGVHDAPLTQEARQAVLRLEKSKAISP